MNVIHMKYAVEVAKAGSINKASETLLVAQPNLSRSIKELEADLGITIFLRTSKGMTLTPKGEEFMGYAKNILSQLDELETMYKSELPAKQTFSQTVSTKALRRYIIRKPTLTTLLQIYWSTIIIWELSVTPLILIIISKRCLMKRA